MKSVLLKKNLTEGFMLFLTSEVIFKQCFETLRYNAYKDPTKR